MRTKLKTSVALSKEALRLLRLLADRRGISKSAVLEVMIRDHARTDGIKER